MGVLEITTRKRINFMGMESFKPQPVIKKEEVVNNQEEVSELNIKNPNLISVLEKINGGPLPEMSAGQIQDLIDGKGSELFFGGSLDKIFVERNGDIIVGNKSSKAAMERAKEFMNI